ncbi:helix-turn-helix transcriptional regulator [Haloarchaeobius sp. TZWWS8]|uniref:helix-turn-helix transcriptional regulator n=1 Tax=Haloarchaeobius sp. TZWWS8 TaxID=3446121 RepID=UPI003EBCB3DA
MRRSYGVSTLVVLLVGATVFAGAFPATAAQPATQTKASSLDAPEWDVGGAQQEFDRTQFRIRVHANGSARFTIRYERNLNGSQEREDFEAFAQEFENNETKLYTDFTRRAESLVATGTNETGREMEAVDFRRSARVETGFNDVGIVELSFRWKKFAQTPNGRVVVGDVFAGGLYIGPSQSLVVEHGDAIRFESVDPSGTVSGDSLQRSESVTWQGERQFADGRPRVELLPTRSNGTPTATGTPGGSTETEAASGPNAGGDDGSFPMLPVMFAVALVGIGAVVVWLRSRDDDAGSGQAVSGAGPQDGSSTAQNAPQQDASGGAPTTANSDGGATTPAISDEELLTDEDRVVRLLERNGGRLRQSHIVDETDWSKSKVSMLLSEMEDEGTISKLRVGRENIVSLAGHEPDAAGSPFEDEEDERR